MTVQPDDMIKVEAAAHLVHQSTKTIRRKIEIGEIIAVRVGTGRGRLFIPHAELLRVYGHTTITATWAQAETPEQRREQRRKVLDLWMHLCETSDPWRVLDWLAEAAMDSWPKAPRAVS